jgi:hypothetical protein
LGNPKSTVEKYVLSGRRLMTKKIEIVFAEGCFDNFDGTQEELDEMIAHIRDLVDSGKLEEEAILLSDEEAEVVLQNMENKETRQ